MKMRFVVVLSVISQLSSFTQAVSNANGMSSAPNIPNITGVFGSPITFATHDEFASYGFAWGPVDGQFGAIPGDNMSYTFYGSGATDLISPTGTPLSGTSKENRPDLREGGLPTEDTSALVIYADDRNLKLL